MLTGKPLEVQKEIIRKTLCIAIIPTVSALIWGEFSSVIGLVFGLAISLLLFRLKLVNIDKALDMSPGKARKYLQSRYFTNYIIYFIVLIVAHEKSNISFLAAVIGLLLLKFTIIGMAIIENIRNGWELKMENLYKERGK
jgi:hypothetical protein